MAARLIDDNGIIDVVDDNGVQCFLDDQGNFTCVQTTTDIPIPHVHTPHVIHKKSR